MALVANATEPAAERTLGFVDVWGKNKSRGTYDQDFVADNDTGG